jgi:hypothetical protein
MSEMKQPSPMYNKALTDAIREIYRVYGPNLAAFFRDVEDPKNHASCAREPQGNLAEVHPRKQSGAHTAR